MSRARKLLLSALVLGAAGVAAGAGTFSAFSSTTSNPSNEFAAGTVTLGDNASGGSVISLSNALPGGTPSTGCIRVLYTGSLASTLKLYATVSGSLAQYLNLTVTRGTESAPSFPSCSTFSADSTDYRGLGPGVLYSGTLNNFPATYATGIDDAAGQTWSNNDAHSYKFQISLPSSAPAAAQGLSASATFDWEARNQ
jgi:predicted ribosomally synthesized peptide with SipW-like signal peptide